MSTPAAGYDDRVLLKAPTRRDSDITREALARAGLRCTVCASLREVARELEVGAGALLMTDSVLDDPELALLLLALRTQPNWSSVPIVLMCRMPEQFLAAALQGFERHVTVLDQPSSLRAMTSAVQSALQGRQWQYQIRDQMAVQARAEDALRQADQRKDRFLATLAHELRNPLAPIRTGLHLLKVMHGAAPESAKVFDAMERQVKHLVKLIDELLDVSRIATGKLILERERVDLRTVIAHAVEGCRPLLDAAAHELRVHVPEKELVVVGDAHRLVQAVLNLLHNAVKFTPRGGRITVHLERDAAQAVVTVGDTGVGIPPDMLGSVFDLFAQVDGELNRTQSGLGIGLSLVRTLVDLHGGQVTACSEGIGRGSSFEIRLPTASSDSTGEEGVTVAPTEREQPARRRLRVMVVDDNVDAADTLAMLLDFSGHAVCVGYSAEAALDMATKFLPEVIFCDIGMPGMSGHVFAAQIRRDRRFAATVLVAVTGWGAEEDQRRAREAGFDHHLTKPVSAESMETILSRR